MSTTDPSTGRSAPTTEVALAPSAEAAARARATLRELLTDVQVSEEVHETAVLLANELVINAFEHAGGAVQLRAEIHAHTVRIEVTDSSPMLPEANASVAELDERGRGLLMVTAMSSRWGVHPAPDGKTVWCEIDR